MNLKPYIMERNDNSGLSLRALIIGFLWGTAFCLCLTLCSCRTVKYVPVETVKTDTLYQTKVERDSIHTHDSIYIHEWQRGDTIYIDRDRWHTLWRDRWRTDTVYRSHTDSIPVPFPVEKPLSKWQQFCLDYGKVTTGGTIALIAFAAIYGVRRLKVKG